MAAVAMASLIALHPADAARNDPADWQDWLAGEATGFSGVVLMGRDDAMEIEMPFGLAGPAASPLNSAGTRFNLGSITKTFTAIGIARLIEQGRLGLDDTLIQHLPDYPDQDAASRITIRQLLTHRSGVAPFMRADFGDISVAAMTRIVGEEPLAFEPGARQQYSNGGYVVLGRVIEVVSGKTYPAFLSDHIYRPAGMVASGFYHDGDRAENLARPIVGSAAAQPRTGNPAGGGYSTAADLFRFARALRCGRLLGPVMTRYVLDGSFAEDPPWGFALREQIAGSHRFLGNGGGAPGVNAEFRFQPAGAYTVVVLSNSSPPSATNLLTAILNRIAGIAPSAAAAEQATTAATGGTPATGLRGEVLALHAEMMSAFREEPANVARHYTDDARILGGGRRYHGTGEVRAYFSQVPPLAEWTLEIVDVGGSNDAPWVLGRSTLARAGTQGMTVDYLAILRRDADGRLRYHIDMFTAGAR
ncbi:MAG TPA: serine hydrolase [Steroidobacteraceae bacterium]|nr:serine hydrolase [Steroidobacteraceae bacterium]